MQMYKVKFKSQRGALLETGSYLACAMSIVDAEALIATQLPFPPSTAEFQTSRIKPSIYELDHHELMLEISQPPPDESRPVPIGPLLHAEPVPGRLFDIEATATVFAHSESTAVRRFVEAIVEHVSAGRFTPSHHINDLSVIISDRPAPPRHKPRFEAQSDFKEHRMFQGGAVRPR